MACRLAGLDAGFSQPSPASEPSLDLSAFESGDFKVFRARSGPSFQANLCERKSQSRSKRAPDRVVGGPVACGRSDADLDFSFIEVDSGLS